ncbi:DUF4430 domain-containing protein [Acholeplasma hippikon]|uniref:Transcobalamin-like C-terminal domain-containing protein n=1 Tax=Acholeplasma hippikon TaxID=264636 RepID=A0A449BI09_9MOLU|nr:DUF4430 domain-containing protein [Acholeplasma hippikon]VEU82080.1 Uncharacterised protein [Acholeplasma hippikon]
MKKTRLIGTIIILITGMIILAISLNLLLDKKEVSTTGEIKIEIIGSDYSLIKSKNITFTLGDNLVDIIKDNFMRVKIEETSFGMFLRNIEGYQTPSDYSEYIAVYVDGIYSEVSIDEIVPKDSTVILLLVESFQG